MFHAYTNALELIRALAPVVEKLKTFDSNLADQVVRRVQRAAELLRTPLRHHVEPPPILAGPFRALTHVQRDARRRADAWGWRVDAQTARALLDRELAMLWRLCHGRKNA